MTTQEYVALRKEVYGNPAALHIISLSDKNIMINFKAHLDEDDKKEREKNRRILKHYRDNYPDLWNKIERLLKA